MHSEILAIFALQILYEFVYSLNRLVRHLEVVNMLHYCHLRPVNNFVSDTWIIRVDLEANCLKILPELLVVQQ